MYNRCATYYLYIVYILLNKNCFLYSITKYFFTSSSLIDGRLSPIKEEEVKKYFDNVIVYKKNL